MNTKSDPQASKSVTQQEFLIATRRYQVSSRLTLVLLFSLFALAGSLHSAEISEPESELRDVLKLHENRGGFAVTVGDDTEGVFYQLSRLDHYAVHGLFCSEETLATVRKRLMGEGGYGKSCAALWCATAT